MSSSEATEVADGAGSEFHGDPHERKQNLGGCLRIGKSSMTGHRFHSEKLRERGERQALALVLDQNAELILNSTAVEHDDRELREARTSA